MLVILFHPSNLLSKDRQLCFACIGDLIDNTPNIAGEILLFDVSYPQVNARSLDVHMDLGDLELVARLINAVNSAEECLCLLPCPINSVRDFGIFVSFLQQGEDALDVKKMNICVMIEFWIKVHRCIFGHEFINRHREIFDGGVCENIIAPTMRQDHDIGRFDVFETNLPLQTINYRDEYQ